LTSEERAAFNLEQKAEVHESTRNQPTRRKSARVTVFANWCKGCGLCVAFCPQHVFEEDEESHPIVAHPELCTGCNWCVVHCPDLAIVVHDEEEPDGSGVVSIDLEEEENE
jgi:NAD-dependent dihydropyrimidine dehydrogenase PreA subunit